MSDERVEHDPGAELGLKNPVRDKEREGEARYSVTPPRSAVRAPTEERTAPGCASCSRELDPVHSYRIDADEYAYHFCGADCYDQWRKASTQERGPAQRSNGKEP